MATTPADAAPDANRPDTRRLVFRHRLSTRIWHWLNAITVFVMLMSGLMIFNAHPRLYWGHYGANADPAWLEIGATDTQGLLRIGAVTIPTTGVLGRWTDHQGVVQTRAFPGWATIPTDYSLAAARRWHLAFAWVLALAGLGYWLWSLVNRHIQRDLVPRRAELAPRHIWRDIKAHARLRSPTGDAATRYNILQKISYLAILFGLLPLMVLSGLAMSPAIDAAWPWIVDLFGGRQSARSVHFICAALILAFIGVHLIMVLLAGPFNEVRSMITGHYRLPPERKP
ncbi:cytochrome b/b6 domain-containing protein [Sphingomonas sp. KC8]|uniref:cytochrome b/b6 domain-containing protein n=1 Tax=Sphingomonas sp. KC8 TaxID=1030157 RepID=UPI000248A743|nr:cytochrome b/b6 domain-containing protein [Sphingomonas sp. KC8]ARS28161.1 Ni/Fe-hydrogenase B-type cytochrome subunit [Sphingomonas sp. KC8]